MRMRVPRSPPGPGRILLCDVSGLVRSDLGAVDALARLELAARRQGARVVLLGAPRELLELLELTGLREVFAACQDSVEARREPEQREPPFGVEEERDAGDPAV